MKFLLASAVLFSACCISLHAAEPLPLSKDYWKDESFLKSFNGSYRINARIEPAVSTAERGLLVSIQNLMASGQREEALKKIQSSPLVKSSAAVAFNAGNIQFELGNMKEAASYYQAALKIFPSFRRAHRNLGFVYTRDDDWDKALESLTEAVRLGDQDGSTFGQLAYGRLQKEQYASALQAFRTAQITQPENVDWKAGVASCLQQLERNEEALALLDEVIKSRPAEPSYYLLQTSVYISLNRNDEAIANLDLLRRMGKLDADNYLLLANLHLRAGSLSLARPVLMRALEHDPKPAPAAALNALDFLTQTESWQLASDFISALEKTYPEGLPEKLDRKQRRLSALIEMKSGDDPAGAATSLAELIKEDPLDADSLILLGAYRVSEKRYQEAEMLLQQAQRVEGYEYDASVELAKLHVAKSRYPDALEAIDRALKIRSTQPMVEYREAVANLLKASN